MSMKEKLVLGLQQLNIVASEAQQQKLLDYLALLLKWNSSYNLTAIRTEQKMLSHHILDSLSLLPYLPQTGSLLDVGSGGGMPGIPCAIMLPQLKITLLDANHKKTTFLRQTIIELALDNVAVETCRVESLHEQTFDRITSRAFSELNDFVTLTRSLLKAGGQWLAMKGVYPYEEIAHLPQGVSVAEATSLSVPFVDAERHLVRLINKES